MIPGASCVPQSQGWHQASGMVVEHIPAWSLHSDTSEVLRIPQGSMNVRLSGRCGHWVFGGTSSEYPGHEQFFEEIRDSCYG